MSRDPLPVIDEAQSVSAAPADEVVHALRPMLRLDAKAMHGADKQRIIVIDVSDPLSRASVEAVKGAPIGSRAR